MKNSNSSNQIIIFTTAKENNGTAYLRDNLSKKDPERFVAVDSYLLFFFILLFKRSKIKGVFALSDVHYLVASSIVRILKIKIPIVLGFFHPDQWKVSLQENISKTQFKVMKKVISNLELSNIIFSSNSGYCACDKLLKKSGDVNILPGVVNQELINKKLPEKVKKLKLITIGRFVEFKISTVIAMIRVVEKLRQENFDIEYTICGDGPLESLINERINESKYRDSFLILAPTTEKGFAEEVLKHHVFFGMGGSLVRAAMLGLPSIVAIQRETEEVCYGLFSDYDHSIMPVFGDPEIMLSKKSIYELVINLYRKSNDNMAEIGMKCQKAAIPYGFDHSIKSLILMLEKAKYIDQQISFFDLIKIRFEKYISRIYKKKMLDS